MTAFMYTADAATDQITAAGHGQQTGAGPASVLNIGGAVPGGLSATTDYFMIVVDANHFKLATSRQNAIAGTAIDITSNGTGTQFFLVGMPHRRSRTYAIGSQVFSDDLNASMDGVTKKTHGLIRRSVPLNLQYSDPVNSWSTTPTNGNGLISTGVAAPSVVASWIHPPFEVGDEILGVEINRRSNGSSGTKGLTAGLFVNAASGQTISPSIASGSDAVESTATTLSIWSVPFGASHVMLAGEQLFLQLRANTAVGYNITAINLLLWRTA